jgi:hypothetical protein
MAENVRARRDASIVWAAIARRFRSGSWFCRGEVRRWPSIVFDLVKGHSGLPARRVVR